MSSGPRHYCIMTVRLDFFGVDFPVGLPGSPFGVVVVVVRLTSVRGGLFGVVSRGSDGSFWLGDGSTAMTSELELLLTLEFVSLSAIDVFELVFVIASKVGSGVAAISKVGSGVGDGSTAAAA